jgi:hypothetical protein
MGRGQMPMGLWWENLKETDQLKDLGIDNRNILIWILKKHNERE